jgi:hypothetical protein
MGAILCGHQTAYFQTLATVGNIIITTILVIYQETWMRLVPSTDLTVGYILATISDGLKKLGLGILKVKLGEPCRTNKDARR